MNTFQHALLKTLVWKALRNALANGYDGLVLKAKPLDVATDLLTYDADLERQEPTPESLVPMIEEFRQNHFRRNKPPVNMNACAPGTSYSRRDSWEH